MLTRPALADEAIRNYLIATYGLPIAVVEFLPLGADRDTAVYRVALSTGEPYFLKLRRGVFDDRAVLTPVFLRAQGARQVMAPLADQAGAYWSRAHGFAWALYPFVAGRDGYEARLSPAQWTQLGENLALIHGAVPPPELARHLPRENYAPTLREAARAVDAEVARSSYGDPGAAQFAALWMRRRGEILRVIERAERLASVLRERDLPFVLCHGDLHPGNLLIGEEDTLAIVDWDTPVLAPKERDLLFLGGGVGGTWNTPTEDALFYRGYGQTAIDPHALSYFHYERIVADLVAYAEELLGAQGGEADRARSLRLIGGQFEAGGVVALADRHYPAE